MQIGETRGEILRLVAKLRTSQRSAAKRSARAPAAAPPSAAAEPRPQPRRPPADAQEPIMPPPRERRPSADDRVRQRRRELDEIRELRHGLESRVGDGQGLRAMLERIEQRVMGLEEAVQGMLQRSRFPMPRRTSSRAPRGWSSSPPSRGASRRPAELAATNDDLSGCMFSGLIDGQLLSDMLQLVSSNSLTGLFVVENDDGRTELFFEEGKIFHAIGPDLEGELAFFAAFSAEHGRYYFRELEELPEERTISSSTQLLILEALRQIDEKGNEDDDAEIEI